MAANAGTPVIGRRKRHRQKVMSEINVTPMVDVMLVLLIIFMVSAPLLTVGVPIDLPQSQAKSLDQDKEPLTLSFKNKSAILRASCDVSAWPPQVFLQNAEIDVNDLIPKLQAVAQARGGNEARIYVRGDRTLDYGTIMKVLGQLSAAGFLRVVLLTDFELDSKVKR
jgi:biopolymer transport protein TolR